MTAYSDLATAASTLDSTLATLVNDAKDFFAKLAVYESSIRTGGQLEGRSDTADPSGTFRAALIQAIIDDNAAGAYQLAKALRLPVRGSGKLAATAFP